MQKIISNPDKGVDENQSKYLKKIKDTVDRIKRDRINIIKNEIMSIEFYYNNRSLFHKVLDNIFYDPTIDVMLKEKKLEYCRLLGIDRYE